MPIERGDSWFSPKSLEGEPLRYTPTGVALCEWKGSRRDYCLFANDKVGRGARGSQTPGDKLRGQKGNSPDRPLRSLNAR
jgi:hypothetical protein